VAPAPVDPALDRERLAFEKQRWEAEQEERRLQREEDIKKFEFEKTKAEQDHQRWMADRDDKRLQEQAEEMRREAEQGRQDERERLKAERKDEIWQKPEDTVRRFGGR